MDDFDFIFDNFTEADFKKVRINYNWRIDLKLFLRLGRGTSPELWNWYGNSYRYIYRQEV